MTSFLNILSMVGSALFMVIFFGLCIFIHELGHFLAARMCGLHVIAFSIGFRKIWAKKIGGVEYRVGWLPFGGYVDLPQIDATGEAKDENGNALPKAAPWKRMVTAFAGPFFNILFGLLIGCVIWWTGLPQDSPKMNSFKVRSVETESPEYRAGLRVDDVIVKRNGKAFSQTWSDFAQSIMLNVGETTLEVRRGGETVSVTYLPAVNEKISPTEKIPYPFFRPEIPVMVFPEKGAPADLAGVRSGDRVLKVNGKEIFGSDDLHTRVYFSLGRPLTLELERAGQPVTVTVQPKKYEDLKPDECTWAVGAMIAASDKGVTVESVIPGMPAENILKYGDVILSVNGKPCADSKVFVETIRAGKGADAALTLRREGAELAVTLKPVYVEPHYLGVSFQILTHPDPVQQFVSVLELTWKSLKSVTAGVKRKLGFDAGYTTLGPEHMSGPIGIGRYLYMSVYRGSIVLGLRLVVVLTYNLGLLNLLPIPVLDGGHITLALLEMIFRRPVSAKVLQPITFAFVFFLIAFMLFVSFYDVKKMLPVSAPPKTSDIPASSTGANAALPNPESDVPEPKEASAHANP